MKSPNCFRVYIGQSYDYFLLVLIFLFNCILGFGQEYPKDEAINSVDWSIYKSPSNLPGYLIPFNDPVTGNKVTRISDINTFGCDCSQLRHRYAKNQPWNSDGTLIMTSGSPSKILDGSTFKVLYESHTKALWSNTHPHYTYDTSSNSTFVKKNIITGVITVLHTFSKYSAVSIGNDEGNLSNDDRYVALIGTSGSNKSVIVYDILNDVIISEKSLGTVEIDWVSVSQSGNFVVISGYSDGSGPFQGIKSYDKFMNNEVHLYSGRPHGDIGFDTQGNEVYVAYQGPSGYSLSYARLDNGAIQGLFPYSGAEGDRGLWGGHISTRNLERPGWAYVSDQGHPTDVNKHEATRENFAIKLDDTQTIERFGKHHSNLNVNSSYYHQAQAVPNRNGTKMLFASNWDDSSLKNSTYPVMFVVEATQSKTSITANAGTDVSICEGNDTKLTATGGSSYLWSTGETTASITVKPEATTTYTVTAYDSSGNNSDTDDVVVTVNPLPTVSAGPDVNLNLGEAITLTASGADSYLWSTGATTASIEVSPNSTTTYTVTGTTNNCEASDAVTVFSVEASVNANAGEDTIICQGSTATLTATGGTSYLWNTGATTASIEVSPIETTTYTVTAYDATGDKSDTDEVLVAVNPLPTVDAGKDVTINSGESVVLTATGTESFKWDTGATEASITVSPTATKTYTVTGTTKGCEVTDTIIVTVLNKSEITANAGKDQTICEGASATLTATGGTSYLWNTGATTASIEVSPIETTTYSVTAYDAKGDKSDTDEVLVTVNPLPTVDAGKDVTINSGENITLTAIGTKTFKWDTGATEASITVSPSATKTYTVTGTTNGCEVTDTVTVTVLNSTQTTADAGMDQTICEGASVTLTATGGDSFLWNTGATTPTIKVSPSQTTTYTVTVSDTSGNTSDTDDVVVTVNPLPTVDAGKNKVIKIGESITLTATGAQSYIWNTGATEASITVSPSTTTTYTVIGSTNGCDATDTITVRVQGSNEVVVDAGKDQSICEGGSVILTATGGETYLWNTGITTASIEVSPSETTTYTVTAYDSKGNPSDSDDVIVTVNPIPIVDAGKDVTINLGESVVLSATGSNNYQWSTGVSGPSINVSPTSTQTYTVTGTSNTCEATDSVTVTVLNTDTTAVKANAGLDQIICYGTSTTLTATGGDTYLWNTGETTSSINVSPTATTKFTVTAYKGDVSSTDEVVVYVDAKPNVTITNGAEAAILEGEFITLSATGADSYLWSNGATEPNIAVSPRATKTYSVTGTINNCEAQKSVVVNVFEKVVANAGSDVTLCRNEKTVLTADGPKNSSYLWSTGETTKSITVEPKSDTEYSVMVYHELDSDTDNVMVKVVNCNSPQGSGQSGQLVQTLEPSRELNDGLTELEFVVYPNPTYGDVNIKISGLTNLSSIHLYDLSGKALYNETINDGEIQSYTKTLDLSQYTSGIYLLQLVDDNRVVTKKIILK
ncbi:putative secreted protein (Por secretion system target) [Gelidibacter sediminis]|uniref:Putative secreted protein (Por secretion system target) n=1 Tax=Gelidibacter sediminis TaxID=1608710 RepID=A0A4R7PYE7_9FLAO|nr:T9SS type A sorting domain-containing protein [Gelidibacter sediminis]TDU40015.1 putative secreted protein (Por secretion system target) [Gelidibacter sediminis]